MVKKAATIEINGRLYDATTGKLVSSGTNTAAAAPRTIDGFSSHITGTHPSRPQPKNAKSVHKVAQKTQKLHPAAVKRPAQPQKIQAVTPKAQPQAVPAITNQPTLTPAAKARLERAQAQRKSAQISRFGAVAQQTPKRKPAAPVRQALLPEEKIAAYQPPALKAVVEPKKPAVSAQEVVKKIEPSQVLPKNEKQKKRKVKLAPTLAVIAVLLPAVGYLTYINIPNFALKVASSRAGFDASIPGYKPTGFEFSGPIAYSPGHLTLSYSSPEAGEYQISQRTSSWDSQSLLDNFVEREHADYLTFQERGLTVYVYEDNKASWVDGGVWYTIEGDSKLTSEQILKIAGSL